jgi:hypothetical protein
VQFDLKTILIIALIVFFVLSVNLTLFGLMRGDKSVKAEASKWGLAVSGGRQAQAKQDAQSDALHRAVADLQRPPEPPDTQPHE